MQRGQRLLYPMDRLIDVVWPFDKSAFLGLCITQPVRIAASLALTQGDRSFLISPTEFCSGFGTLAMIERSGQAK